MKVIRTNKWILGVGIIIASGAVGIISWVSVHAMSAEVKSSNPKSVKAMLVEPKQFGASGEYAGFVRGVDQATVATKISGRIVSLNKQEGDLVKKGEIVAVLSADELVAQTQGAQKTIAALQKTLADTKKYYNQKVKEAKDNNATSAEVKSAKRMRDLQLQSVQTEIVNAQGSLRVAQSYSGETIIRAPFSGIVTRVFQEVGQLVGPTSPVCEIANQAQLSVELFVPQEAAAQVTKGEKLMLLCGDEKKECQGIIDAISPSSELNAQKSLVRVLFTDKNAGIHLGQYVVAKFPMNDNKQNKIVVPEQALVSKYNENFVFVVENNLAKERQVVMGQAQEGVVEILEGLSLGERVIIEGAPTLRNNDEIKVYE